MHFLERIKRYFVPSEQNAYRPGILGKKSILFFLGVILAAEGFLVANLVGRHGADFLAAVIGSEIISLTNIERARGRGAGVNPECASSSRSTAQGRGYGHPQLLFSCGAGRQAPLGMGSGGGL